MYVSFEEYTAFGYDSIPEMKFLRNIIKAGKTVERLTLGRVTDDRLQEPAEDALTARTINANKRGICEIAELYFDAGNVPRSDDGMVIKSFSNTGYSETYADNETADARNILSRRIDDVMEMFFSRAQRFRGVGV